MSVISDELVEMSLAGYREMFNLHSAQWTPEMKEIFERRMKEKEPLRAHLEEFFWGIFVGLSHMKIENPDEPIRILESGKFINGFSQAILERLQIPPQHAELYLGVMAKNFGDVIARGEGQKIPWSRFIWEDGNVSLLVNVKQRVRQRKAEIDSLFKDRPRPVERARVSRISVISRRGDGDGDNSR